MDPPSALTGGADEQTTVLESNQPSDLQDMDLGDLLLQVQPPSRSADAAADQADETVQPKATATATEAAVMAATTESAELSNNQAAEASAAEEFETSMLSTSSAAAATTNPADSSSSTGQPLQSRASFATYGVAHYHLGETEDVPTRASFGSYGVEHYHLGAEDEDDGVPAGQSPSQSFEDWATEARNRMAWLCSDDQKTVCRRECEMARKREEALIQQLNAVADYYLYVLDLSRSLAAEGGDSADAGLLPEDLAVKYEERVQLLRGTVAALATEPIVSLPKLTAVERMKGFTFAAYAHTATVAKQIGDNTGATDPMKKVASGAMSALGRLSSRWRGSSQSETSASESHATADATGSTNTAAMGSAPSGSR
mmetsp:Transcript_738/g.1546  ORF Transcript_738/g.1546 Transcript_738/m.1546 type:complete len:371 (+) Transcript_738:91-1203(+)